MTTVYITRTGTKYHASQGCPSFDAAEQEHGHAIERWGRELKGLTHAPCSVCWPREPDHDAWRELGLEVERAGDSPYEAMFVERVLRHVPGLRPSDVSTQRKASGRSGNTYFLDFVLAPSGGHRIAVEIDGRDKDPGGKSAADVQRNVDQKRADLIDAGWRVLNFSNERVGTRSEECVSELRAALQDSVSARDASVQGVSPGRVHTPSAPAQVAFHAAPAAVMVNERPRSGRWIALTLGVVVLLGVLGFGRWLMGVDNGGAVDPVGGECPSDASIKGNVSQDGERIFHRPGWVYYSRTDAEECFANASDAESAGYRASEVQ